MSPPMFLQLLGKHFPPSNSFHKIFNRNTIKVSYCCTQNLGSIIKSHNKKLISSNNRIILPRHCRRKEECPLEENAELMMQFINALLQQIVLPIKFRNSTSRVWKTVLQS